MSGKQKNWEELTVSEKFDILIDLLEDIVQLLQELRNEIEERKVKAENEME